MYAYSHKELKKLVLIYLVRRRVCVVVGEAGVRKRTVGVNLSLSTNAVIILD